MNLSSDRGDSVDLLNQADNQDLINKIFLKTWRNKIYMAYMISLTVREATFLGVTGCACLIIGYGLAQVVERVDKINRSKTEAITNTSIENNEISIINRITPNLSIYMKRVAASVSATTMLSLSCLAFLLWCVGTVCITYAAVGPLLV